MHKSCLVIVPEGEDPKLVVKELMAPHVEDYNESTNECSGWWDWYRIGGRWDGQILGLAPLSDETHFTDAWSTLERNAAPAREAGEFASFTVLSPDGFSHREFLNPAWEYKNGEPPFLDTPDFAQWRAEQLLKYRSGTVVVVDYHS